MNVTIFIPTAFRKHTQGVDRLECSAMNVNDMIEVLEVRFP